MNTNKVVCEIDTIWGVLQIDDKGLSQIKDAPKGRTWMKRKYRND